MFQDMSDQMYIFKYKGLIHVGGYTVPINKTAVPLKEEHIQI